MSVEKDTIQFTRKHYYILEPEQISTDQNQPIETKGLREKH